MKKLLIIALFPLACLGSTITGYIIDQSGTAKTGQITFRPLSTPMIISTQYVSGSILSLTLTNGGFTNTLLQGDYLLVIGGVESPRISVPDDTNTYNFIELINTNGLLYAFKQPGAVVKLDQYDSVFGFLGDKLSFTAPLTPTTNNFGANESVTLSMPRSTNGISGYLHSDDWITFNAKQGTITLSTVTGVTNTFNTTNYLRIVINGVTNKIATINE